MPGIGATDSADLVAQARAETGLSRQLKQTRRELPHPRDGGSSGYPDWFRDEQLAKWYAGEATEVWKSVVPPTAKQARLRARRSWGLT